MLSKDFSFENFCFFDRPLLANIAERYNTLRRPRIINSESITKDDKLALYTSCSFDAITDEKMICTLSILPQVDQLPHMFTYVSLQRNFLVNYFNIINKFLKEYFIILV